MTPTAFAFFDFDDTLCPGDSILPYLLFCIHRGVAPRRQLLKAAVGFIKWKLNPAHASASKETSLSFIRGRRVDEMDKLARDFFREKLLPRCYPDGLAEIQQLRVGIVCQIVLSGKILHQRLIGEYAARNGVGRIVGNACRDFSRQRRNIACDVVQRIFAKNAAVMHLYHEAAFGVLARGNVAGVPIHTDACGLDIHTQHAYIGKPLFQLNHQGLAVLALAVQKFRKGHMYFFLSFCSKPIMPYFFQKSQPFFRKTSADQ